jgi:hypothetical protein
MLSKKIIFVVGVFLVLGLLVMSFVVGQDDPQLAPFEASVGLSNAPPTIVAFRTTVDDVPTGDGQVTPIAGTTVTAHVTFIVQDPNYDNSGSPDELPGIDPGNTISVGDVSGAGNVYVILSAPSDALVGSGTTRTAGSCVASSCHAGTDSDCDATTVGEGDGTDFIRQVKYTCDVAMEYFDAPGPGTLGGAPGSVTAGESFWHIEVQIKDTNGATDSVTSGTVDHAGQITYDFDDPTCGAGSATVGDCDYIDYFTVSDVDVNPGDGATGFERLLWANIDIAAFDSPADDDNTGGDTGLTLRNIGNTAVTTIDLQVQDLTGDIDGGATLHAESMSVGLAAGSTNAGSCDVDDVAVGGSGGGESFIRICLCYSIYCGWGCN